MLPDHKREKFLSLTTHLMLLQDRDHDDVKHLRTVTDSLRIFFPHLACEKKRESECRVI